MFDDLFFSEIIKSALVFPILFSISLGFFFRNMLVILVGALIIGMGYEIFSEGGRIIVQSIAAAGIAHSIGALGGFFVSKMVR